MVAFRMEEWLKAQHSIVDDHLQLPLPRKPQNGTKELPYVFVGDGTVTLSENFLIPFRQKGLNPEWKIAAFQEQGEL
jgi:hypothetical protein